MSEEDNIKLSTAFRVLLPELTINSYNEEETVLAEKTEENISSYLNSFYLFPLEDIFVPASLENKEIAHYINDKYQTLLSAAYAAGLSVATVLNGNNGKITLYIGFKNNKQLPREYFESLLNGIIPHTFSNKKETQINSLTKGMQYGGIVTGVPTIEKKDKRFVFNIASVVRSMYGRNFTLLIESTPVPREKAMNDIYQLADIKDYCHKFVKTTVNLQQGGGNAKQIGGNEQYTENENDGFSLILINSSEGNSYSQGKNWSETENENWSLTISEEQQNSIAIELEKIAENYLARITNGLNIGYWATTVSYAADNQISAEILGGSFVGELSKPGTVLYPPRKYHGTLKEQTLFIPCNDESSPIFEKSLSSYLNSSELAFIASPPIESLPGYEIKRSPNLALSDIGTQGEYQLGQIVDKGMFVKGLNINLSKSDLNKHLFVAGLTGSGKTTTVRQILKNIITDTNPTPFLVIESAKRDYRQLLADESFKNKLRIYTIGEATISPISFNIFYLQKGVNLCSHIDNLKAIFNASFSLYGPMPYILEKCLYNVYQRKGWDLTSGSHPAFTNKNGNSLDSDKLDAFYEIPEHIYYFPTLSDLKEEVDYYIRKELSYANEQTDNIRTAIVVRLESLCTGAKGSMFNTYGFTSMEDLLNQSAVFEMEHLADDDDKAFFVGLMLTFISEYRQLQNPAINVGIEKGLKHFLIIEEAHRLLKNINTERSSEEMGNPKGKAVETFCNIISEMRGLGQGVAVIEQIPTKISPDVIKNSNTKIIHRLVAKDDQKLVASSLCINEAEALYLGQLTTGHALVHKEGMEKPLECLVYNDIHIGCITDEKVHSLMKSYKQNDIKQHSSYSINLNREERQWVLFKFLNTLAWNNMINIDLKDIVKTVQNDILIRLPNVVSEKELNSYIAKSLIEAISYKMFWAQNYSFKSGFLETCYKLFDKKTDDSAFDFLKILSDTWGVNAEGLLQDNLINYLKIKCTNKNYDTLQNDLKHCFLACVDNDTIEFINSKIKEIL